MAMVGDVIFYVVLFGIVIVYFLLEFRDVLFMFIGVVVFGVFMIFMIEFFYQKVCLQIDVFIGIIFIWLFVIGIILILFYVGQVDFDQDCVLYGEIVYVLFDLWIMESGCLFGLWLVWILSGVLVLILFIIIFGYCGLKIMIFDFEYVVVVGIFMVFWYYFLMSVVFVIIVVVFELVGVIFVVVFLIVFLVIVYLFIEKLYNMFLFIVGFGIFIVVSGYYFVVWIDGFVVGAMVVSFGVFLFLVVLFFLFIGVFMQCFC